MSVPLQSVPENRHDMTSDAEAVVRAKHEAAEIIARARKQAESIVADAKSSGGVAQSPLAALGDNAEEIIGQVRKLIKKQRQLQTERENMINEIASLKAERDELVQRLTDAVERMEELAKIADVPSTASTPPPRTVPVPERPTPPSSRPAAAPSMPAPNARPTLTRDPDPEDTSLAARLRQAEREEKAERNEEAEDSSLAARLERAEKERNARVAAEVESADELIDVGEDAEGMVLAGDGRSFYDRHSAKLPRLEGDGGRSVLSAIGDMRPDSEPKGRKGRRRKNK